MVSKKYAKDYRLENTLGPDGRIITVAVYCGEYYSFTADKRKLRRARAYFALAAIFYWVFFWLGLTYDTGSMRQLYVSAPYFCGFLPAVYLSSAVYYLIKYSARPPVVGFTREQRDRVYSRIAGSSLLTLILGALGAVGLFFYFIFEYPTYGGTSDIITVIAISVMTATSAALFRAKKHTKMQPLS